MIDPYAAASAATTIFNSVTKLVYDGQEFEDCMEQMGKWYTAVSDFRKGQQLQKNPSIFRKLLDSGSIEEEAHNLLVHEKKIIEMEKELQTMLNMRFGFGTLAELKDMHRSIRTERERNVYKQIETTQALINGVAIFLLLGAFFSIVVGLFYSISKSTGMS